MQINKTSDKKKTRISILNYGPSGIGKTSLASSLEKTLIISAESGLLSLKKFDIDYVTVNSIKDLREIITMLKQGTDYKNIFIDSITEISRIVLDELNQEYPDRKDTFVLYGEYAKLMRGIVISFRDLEPYDVILTALPKVEKDETNKRFTTCDLTGKIASQLPAYFDEVFYYDFVGEENTRALLTQGSDKIVAKDRSGRLKKYEKPNLQAIINKIKGE